MASADVHHRTSDFRALYQRVVADLKIFIGTKNDVLLLASSGSGAMEASVANLTSPGDRVLVLSAGKFGERWRDLAKAFNCKVDVVEAPYGETISLDAVKAKLAPGTRALYMQATESSTGVRHDVGGVARLLRGTDTLLIVDAITGLGTTHFDVDGWGVDVIIGGSQKAVMIPPGMAYLSISDRAWKRMETASQPRYYFDLLKERKVSAKGESAFTPPTSLVVGLAAAFDFLRDNGHGDLAAGRGLLIENAELAAKMTRSAVTALGLELFAPKSPAAALTAIMAPAGISADEIVKRFRDQFGAVVADGQAEMKGKIFRIAHLGYYDYMDTIGAIAALEQIVADLRPEHIEFGLALRAAQEVFAQARAEKSQANAK
jgi:aspartate aminotransferase-like enzyme